MRKIGAMVVAMALVTAQTAFADDLPASTQAGPLAPGPAAGVHAAQNGPPSNMVFIGAGLVLGAAAIYLIVGTNYHVPAQKSAQSAASTGK